MGKTCKVVMCGPVGCGKTALLEQLIYGNHTPGTPMFSTIEDIYIASIDTEKGQKEKIHFYDTAGLDLTKPELPKQYFSFADGYVVVYDVTNKATFDCIDKLKKEIDKNKDKKEALIIAIGNKCDLKDGKQVDFPAANKWAQREKVRLWEVSVVNRTSLVEPFVWLTSKMTQPPSKSTFLPIGKSGRQKQTNVE